MSSVPAGGADRLSWRRLPRDIGKRLEVRRTVTACLGEAGHITRLEHVQARLTLSYNRRGDLAIHLVSPMGTRSTLLAARCLPAPLRSPPSPPSPLARLRSCTQLARRAPNTLSRGLGALPKGRFRPGAGRRGCPVLQESLTPPLTCSSMCLPCAVPLHVSRTFWLRTRGLWGVRTCRHLQPSGGVAIAQGASAVGVVLPGSAP